MGMGTLARGNILFNWASDLGKALWLTYVVWWLYLWLKLEGSGLQISALFVFCYHTIYIASKTNKNTKIQRVDLKRSFEIKITESSYKRTQIKMWNRVNEFIIQVRVQMHL